MENCAQLESFSGLNKLRIIKGELIITACTSLKSFAGMHQLETTEGLIIDNCPALENLFGLEKLKTINGELTIAALSNLKNIYSLKSLIQTKNFKILLCPKLQTLTGLENLQAISGELVLFNNTSLKNIQGLSNLESVQLTKVSIRQNDSLTDCAIETLCTIISDSLIAVTIQTNNTGCNSEEEILENCIYLDDQSLDNEQSFSISPNPCRSYVRIISSLSAINTIRIFDQSGALVSQENTEGLFEVRLSVEQLKKGLYIIEIQCTNKIYRKKLVRM